MPQTINTNIASLNAQRNLNVSQNSMSTSLQRLSTGLRINSAKDDAAGLAIAERMTTQIRGMSVAQRNAADGVSMVQTAEGGLASISENLQRMRELSVQAANATTAGAGDVTALAAEFTALSAENTRIVDNTKFNGLDILKTGATHKFQVGADASADNQIDVVTTATAFTAVAFTDAATARTAITALDTDIAAVSAQRAGFGAAQSRFESSISNLQRSSENLSAARGRITDADFAVESANLSRTQVLQQAGMAMLTQANQMPQNVLSLVR